MSQQDRPDVVLIGAGMMSATLGTFLTELDPSLTIAMFEALHDCAQESSGSWNNAGTGHAANCELNYTPEREDGSIDISKALEAFASPLFHGLPRATRLMPSGCRKVRRESLVKLVAEALQRRRVLEAGLGTHEPAAERSWTGPTVRPEARARNQGHGQIPPNHWYPALSSQ